MNGQTFKRPVFLMTIKCVNVGERYSIVVIVQVSCILLDTIIVGFIFQI